MAGQPHGVFFFLVSSIIVYVLLLSLVLGVRHPASFASLYVICSVYFPLLFSPWSSVPVTFSLSKSSS